MQSITEFKAALAAADCASDTEIISDDKIRRFHIIGDRPHKLNGRYRLAAEGDFAYGWFIDSRAGVRHDFHTKGQQLTAQELEAQREKMAAQRKASEQARREAQKAAAERAGRIWLKSLPAPPDNAYLKNKGIPPGGLRGRAGVLIVPMYDDKGVLCSLQFIKGREKKYLKDGAKGTYCLPGSGPTALCEGYATGATINMATGWRVVVCFDSAGLKANAARARSFFPDCEIIVCADSDQWVFKPGQRPEGWPEDLDGNDPRWTEARKSGLLFNPGIEAATAALKKVAGNARLVNPKFKNAASRPTDFNDLMALEGIEAVKQQLMTPVSEAPPLDDIPPPTEEDLAGEIPLYDPESIESPIETGPFKIMGYNEGIYYYLPRASGQLVDLTAGAHNKNNLYRLAPEEWWQHRYGKRGGGVNWDAAANALIQLSHRRGVFRVETMLRGSGVWMDKGRVIAHCGDRLLVDGAEVEPFMVGSAYVYQKSGQIYEVGKKALEDIEAEKVMKIFESLKWKTPLSAILGAGWVAIAPLSGALKWRPHIYIDGEKGSGKSWVNDEVIKALLGKCAIRVGSGTTEAGLRRMVGNDARPIIMDEMEGEDKKQKEIRQAILLMARKASSGESMVIADSSGKGTMVFKIFSMFSMSSINTGVVQGADLSRFSHLELVKNLSANSVDEFTDIQAFVKETLTEEYISRLLRRTIDNARTILKNVQTFSEAAAIYLKDRRAGDQIGPMLAGAFSLYNNNEVSREKAMEWISKKDWSNHTSVRDKSDHEKLFDHIQTTRLKVSGTHKNHETQIGTAIAAALGYIDENYTATEAKSALQSIDIKIKENEVWIRKPSQHIARLLSETPWEISWHKSIQNIEGITQSKNPQSFGISSAFVIIIPKEKFKPEGMML